MSADGRKNQQSLAPDILSNLPDNVIDVILMHLRCKDAVRTCILSRKWRYHWCRLTKFTLDESLWRAEKDKLYPTVKFIKIIYQFLTHHEGPVTKFKLTIDNMESCPKIDNFIYFLSRNDIQHLILHLPHHELYQLPSSVFICSQLRHLNLHNCLVFPTLAFKGFDRLISLELCRVTVSSELLGSLISRCPLLEQLVLKNLESLNIVEINAPMLRCFDFTGRLSSLYLKNVPHLAKVSLIDDSSSMEAENFNYAKFFKSSSALEDLRLEFSCSEFFADETPTRLRFDLNRVKRFCLYGILVMDPYKLSCALCLLRSFPYLEYITIEIWSARDAGVHDSLELECFSDVTFNHLRDVQIGSFKRTTPELQLIKLFLAKSPVLVKMLIYPIRYDGSLGTRSEMLAELSKFWRASPKAEVVLFDLKW